MGIIESTAAAARERLWSHTVGIANRAIVTHGTDPATGLRATEHEAPGTGMAGVWGERYFILTASHVLEKAQPSDLSFFVRQTSELKSQAASDLKVQDSFRPVALTDPSAEIHHCTWEDIAVVTMQPSSLGSNLEFFDLANSWVDPTEGQTIFGIGYPVSDAVIFRKQVGTVLEKAVLLSPTPFSGFVLPRPTDDDLRFKITAFDEDRHYLFDYEPATRGKHPKGISGASAFTVGSENSLVWSPKFNFAGTCTSCYKDGKVEQVVKASSVAKFLLEALGPAGR